MRVLAFASSKELRTIEDDFLVLLLDLFLLLDLDDLSLFSLFEDFSSLSDGVLSLSLSLSLS